MELKVSCCFLSTIFSLSQLTLTLNCYSAMISSWCHLISLVPKWKTHSNSVMTQHIRERSRKLSTPQMQDGVATLDCAKTQDRSIFSTPTQMKNHSLFGTTFRQKWHHAGTSPSICFTNQFTESYMTQVPTAGHFRTCFSMEIIKTSQKHPNFRKPLYILTIPKSEIMLKCVWERVYAYSDLFIFVS